MRGQKQKQKQKQLAPQECFNEADKLKNLDALPRDFDTFWHTDTLLPPSLLSGHSMLRIKSLNKSTAFTHRERQLRSIHGLLPVAVCSLDTQVEGCCKYLETLSSDFQKYIFLTDMESTNRKLFYRLLMSNPEKYLSVFHSSKLDFAVKNYSYLYTNVQGMFITIKDRGHIYEILRNWPQRYAVRYLIVTNGESVLSIGDHGMNAAAMVLSKMYQNVVYGGIKPDCCMPVILDMGTNNEQLLSDPLYVGLPQRRTTGREYEAFFEEFTVAIIRLFGPRTIIESIGFSAHDSSKQLELFRKRQCYIDIDLQCMGACGLAGLLSANRITKGKFTENTLLFYGDGAFNIGMARMCLAYLKRLRMDESSAKDRIWFCDDKGLIVNARCDHKVPEQLQEFKKRHEPVASLVEAIASIKPNVLLGCSSQANVFSKEVIKAMEQSAQQPIIFAMSRPAELAECSANDAFVYTKGRCIFISAIQLPPLKYANKLYQPGYCTVNYLAPGLTMGVMLSGMTSVPDETFLMAADRLANLVWPNDLAKRDVFPPIRKMRCINQQIAEAVFSFAYRRRLATLWPEPSNPRSYIDGMMYRTEYGQTTAPIYCTADRFIGTSESVKYYKHNI